MQVQNTFVQEESDLKKINELFSRHKLLFITCFVSALIIAILYNHFAVPVYKISSAILIKDNAAQQRNPNPNDYLNSNLLMSDQNFQNELWVLKSSSVMDQTIRNLNLRVSYYERKLMRKVDSYNNVPFQISVVSTHPQPLNVRFKITFISKDYFQIEARSTRKVSFYQYDTEEITHEKEKWNFVVNGKFNELIQNQDLAFIVKPDTTKKISRKSNAYEFDFKSIAEVRSGIMNSLQFRVADRLSTVIEMSIESTSLAKGKDILNEMMNVYSIQNLERKNHIANTTIEYIEKQLNEISDSLNQTEDNLQRFRSSNQLLSIADQSAGMTAQYMDLQNQLAELVSRKRYYDYVADYLENNVNFSNMMLPASLGIQDQLLNNLMSELITAQAQRSSLIENNQEKNPLVQKLNIQITNAKRTISENITAVAKTTDLSIDEMNKRIQKTESDINRLPITQRKLGNIERKYRLNDAIYNYLMEKRAEAKITRASNLPDNIIIEPAEMAGFEPVFPNKSLNYLIAVILGIAFPLLFVSAKNTLNARIEMQEDVEKLTLKPVLGKILHNSHKTKNIMFDFPKSNIAESFRALRTNLDFYIRGGQKKVIMVTSCMQDEGKTFISINIATSYAQLGKRTILVNFDLRKHENYFHDNDCMQEGLSSYLISKNELKDVILKSPVEKLDYIPAGAVPPNPVELIASEKTRILIEKLRSEYDVIIIDTTPLAQVTDGYLLIENAELKLIVARQKVTPKKIFSLLIKDVQLKKIENVCIVLNDNKIPNDQYGYGYGYKSGEKLITRVNGEKHNNGLRHPKSIETVDKVIS
jgi:capsular exopolysaccharide synthesis family protein